MPQQLGPLLLCGNLEDQLVNQIERANRTASIVVYDCHISSKSQMEKKTNKYFNIQINKK